MSQNVIELRKQAEKAVADMKEGSIKEKAFEVILGYLLSGQNVSSMTKTTLRKSVSHIQNKKPHTSKSGPMARVAELVSEGFFKKARGIADVRKTLRDRGHHYPVTTLSPTLVRLTRAKTLRRTREKLEGSRAGFVYTNW